MSSTTQNNTVTEQNTGASTSPAASTAPTIPSDPSRAINFSSAGAIAAALYNGLIVFEDITKMTTTLSIQTNTTEYNIINDNYSTMIDQAEQEKSSLENQAYASLASGIFNGIGAAAPLVMAKSPKDGFFGYLKNSTKTDEEEMQKTQLEQLKQSLNQNKGPKTSVSKNRADIELAGHTLAPSKEASECLEELRSGDTERMLKAKNTTDPQDYEDALSLLQPSDINKANSAINDRIDIINRDISTKITQREGILRSANQFSQFGSEGFRSYFLWQQKDNDFNANMDKAESMQLSSAQRFADDARNGFASLTNTFADNTRKQADAYLQALRA